MNTPTIVCMDCDEPLLVDLKPNRDFSGNIYNSVTRCPACKVEWEYTPVIAPPLKKPDLTPKPKESDASASCFNHDDNEAEAECECGKLLCKVCTFSQYGKPQCVNCLISEKKFPDLKKTRLIRYDWMANYAIGLTFITLGLGAPLAMYFLVRHLMSGEEPLYGGKIAAFIKLLLLLGLTLVIGGGALFALIEYIISYQSQNPDR